MKLVLLILYQMKMLEKLVSAYEVREFAYFTNRGTLSNEHTCDLKFQLTMLEWVP